MLYIGSKLNTHQPYVKKVLTFAVYVFKWLQILAYVTSGTYELVLVAVFPLTENILQILIFAHRCSARFVTLL